MDKKEFLEIVGKIERDTSLEDIGGIQW